MLKVVIMLRLKITDVGKLQLRFDLKEHTRVALLLPICQYVQSYTVFLKARTKL